MKGTLLGKACNFLPCKLPILLSFGTKVDLSNTYWHRIANSFHRRKSCTKRCVLHKWQTIHKLKLIQGSLDFWCFWKILSILILNYSIFYLFYLPKLLSSGSQIPTSSKVQTSTWIRPKQSEPKEGYGLQILQLMEQVCTNKGQGISTKQSMIRDFLFAWK